MSMNSFNNLEKVIYSNNEDSVVALKEYVLFDEKIKNCKYLILKFYNTLSQKICKIKFEITQFDENKNLLAKSIMEHDKFEGEANQTFIPDAKMKVHKDCVSIEYRLIYARFETLYYENGALHKISFDYKDYQEKLDLEELKKETKTKKKKDPNRKWKKKALKRERKQLTKADKRMAKHGGLYIERRFKIYKSFIERFLIFILTVGMIVLTYFSIMNFSSTSSELTYLGTTYSITYHINGDGNLSVVEFDGRANSIEIPYSFGGRTIVSINRKAFNNDNVKAVTINANLIIDDSAFYNCPKLERVNGNGILTISTNSFVNCEGLNTIELLKCTSVNENAFNNCPNITYLDVESATVERDAFSGLDNLRTLAYGDTKAIRFTYLFSARTAQVPDSLTTVYIGMKRITKDFLSGTPRSVTFVALDYDAVIDEEILDYFN